MLALRRHCLQKITVASTSRNGASIIPLQTSLASRRPFSSSDDDNNNKNKNQPSDADFFLATEETLSKPPSYVRDSLTGKWTSRTQPELTKKEARLLSLDEDAKDDELMRRMEQRWNEAAQEENDDKDGLGSLNSEQERVASRIQEENLALGTIGRGAIPSSQDHDAVPLNQREVKAFKSYASKVYGINPQTFQRELIDDPDLLPHASVSSGTSPDRTNEDATDVDLAYLDPKLNKMAYAPEGTEYQHSDPFSDLLPSDFDPARKVNRRHAKPLPPKALHHNNLVLLRRYSTPGGKIMNRVQSRLGAKDQRKVAKLIKRARHLGLIPHMGQWKFEDHGSLHDATLEEKREWETELEERGLWPLAEDEGVFKRYYGMEEMLDRIAGERGEKKREMLEELLNQGIGGGMKKKGQDDV